MRKKTTIVALALAGVVASSLAASAKTSYLGEFKDWGVYQNSKLAGNKCYALTVPLRSEPSTVKHGDNFIILSKENGKYSPQLVMGYPLKPGKEVSVTVDSKRFPFFAEGNRAWTENVADEARLVSAMRAGKTLKVQATSARGTQTRYSFSLMGLSAALQRVDRCP
ncbi:invasion associated locus B family protein [Brucella inopinata]|uniref:Invasion associated locus B family protein n=1 Tax=Brucella inopinata TaxID=1218315 RepID=A0AAW7B3R9_9HYPH|nr:invasion associated locus B family protein [Brucella inopinata]EFM57049.1 signal peptide protein [Brucella inopinata BO1]MDL2332445.1 invasion associated locus B family protein [Brucella inopinata]